MDDAQRSYELYEQGLALTEAGRLEEAAAAYRRAVELAPQAQPAWFNLGLLAKRQRRWDECLEANRRAAELDPDDQGAWWNMGIAATALRRWGDARHAWRGCGLEMPDGDGPIELDYGWVCLRLNPDEEGEVVWCKRIDPARAIIQNIPLPTSGHRWGDCVLHDGEPKGERVADGQTYTVFDELERWQPSEMPTLQVTVSDLGPEHSDALAELFEAHGLAAEDWSGSIRRLCRACSEGRPGEHHHGHEPVSWQTERVFGLAAPPETAERLLGLWAADAAGRRYGELEQVG